jgi:hypothetical protein
MMHCGIPTSAHLVFLLMQRMTCRPFVTAKGQKRWFDAWLQTSGFEIFRSISVPGQNAKNSE